MSTNFEIRKEKCPWIIKETIASACSASDAGGIFSILTDGITDKNVVEEDAIYITFIADGMSKICYLSITSVKNGNTKIVCDLSKQPSNTLQKSFCYVPRDSLVTIYKSFIRPQLDYVDVICDKVKNEALSNQIDSAQYNGFLQ